ncbi:MAG TPA: RNAase P [Thermoplasmata archaeon]|nr:RNAase P [Thermoplasmata archaeon]
MQRRGRRGRRTRETVVLVRDRIRRLFELAEEETLAGHRDLADRYMVHARKLSMRYNVRIPRPLKRRMCPRCHAYLAADAASWRVRRGRVIVHCLRCGAVIRRPFR